jgi:hypothetical protein
MWTYSGEYRPPYSSRVTVRLKISPDRILSLIGQCPFDRVCALHAIGGSYGAIRQSRRCLRGYYFIDIGGQLGRPGDAWILTSLPSFVSNLDSRGSDLATSRLLVLRNWTPRERTYVDRAVPGVPWRDDAFYARQKRESRCRRARRRQGNS